MGLDEPAGAVGGSCWALLLSVDCHLGNTTSAQSEQPVHLSLCCWCLGHVRCNLAVLRRRLSVCCQAGACPHNWQLSSYTGDTRHAGRCENHSHCVLRQMLVECYTLSSRPMAKGTAAPGSSSSQRASRPCLKSYALRPGQKQDCSTHPPTCIS
jgi:hypothetical protein